jgi:hypothetical protein
MARLGVVLGWAVAGNGIDRPASAGSWASSARRDAGSGQRTCVVAGG